MAAKTLGGHMKSTVTLYFSNARFKAIFRYAAKHYLYFHVLVIELCAYKY